MVGNFVLILDIAEYQSFTSTINGLFSLRLLSAKTTTQMHDFQNKNLFLQHILTIS